MPTPKATEVFQRPPYLGQYHSTDEPLTVLPAFLSRADSTPLSKRPRDPHNVVDTDGNVITNPAADPTALAFEKDANVGFEKWDEYWRKGHGIRFTYKDTPDDRSMDLMLCYDQVHRCPGGPTSYNPPPYSAPVDENGRLFTDMHKRIPEYQRPQWDGFAYMAFRNLDELTVSFGQGKFPAKIVPEERVMFRAVPHLIAKQFIIIPSVEHRDPIVLVKIHRRTDPYSRELFQKYWLEGHANLVLSQRATHRYVKRYAQLHNTGPANEGELFWHSIGHTVDGITVMSFASMNDVEDYLMTDDYAELEKDEQKFSDAQRSEYFTCINYNLINRLYPELATRR